MAINGVKAEVTGLLKSVLSTLSPHSSLSGTIQKALGLLGDIPKLKKPLEDILDQLAVPVEDENATALLEECVYNGDKGMAELYAWFMGEREVIEAAINDWKEERQL